jgi:PAS domain S-box-containing protein
VSARPRRRIFWRTSAVFLGLLALFTLVQAALTVRFESPLIRRNFHKGAEALLEAVARAAPDLLAAGESGALSRLFAALSHDNPDIESALVTDRAGHVVAHSRPSLEGTLVFDLAPPPAHAVLRETEGANGPILQATAPIEVRGEPWGAVRFEISLAPLLAENRRALARVVMTAAVFLALGAIGAAWLARSVSRPIERLVALAGEVARGNLGARSDIRSTDEVGRLAEALNDMAEKLDRALAKLRESSTSLERMVAERTQELEKKTRALEMKERELSDFVENAPDPILVLSFDGTVRAANRACEKASGYAQRDLIGRSILDLLTPASRERMGLVASLIARREPIPAATELELVARDGRVVPGEATFRPVYDGDRVREIQCVARPIAERRELERRRIEEAKLTTAVELAGAAAHELFQPLTGIMGLAELMAEADTPPEDLQAMAAQIRTQARRMTEIVRRMTELTSYRTVDYVGGRKIADLGAHPAL